MRRAIRSALVAIVGLVLSSACAAQGARALPAEGAAFLAEWRRAAATGDGEALARLAQLPFLFDGHARGRAEFVAIVVPALFTPAVRRCLQRAHAQAEDDRFVLWCKPYAFYVGPVQGRWRLIEFGADAE